MKKVLFICLSIIALTAGAYAQIAKQVVEDAKSPEKTMKNAPFSAQAITESVQVLWDGTKITRRTTSRLYRDNEGRFRREDSKTQLGVPGDNVEIAESIRITDPVTGLKYNLDVKDRTYKQSSFGPKKDVEYETRVKQEEQRVKQEEMKVKQKEWSIKQQENREKQAEKKAQQAERRAEHSAEVSVQADNNGNRAGDGRVKIERGPGGLFVKPPDVNKPDANKPDANKPDANKPDVKIAGPSESSDKKAKVESLGTQNVEGVMAEGTRTTTTIPMGTIGNDRDINVVYEKWYSKELQLTVLSKHTDPRFGEQTYRLTNISRDNPPMSLFQPPADYKNDDDEKWLKGPGGPMKLPKMDIKAPKPPAPDIKKPTPPAPSASAVKPVV
jgi:hypothetical protein